MLDDISFDNCVDGDVPEGSDQLSCDFEKDTCSWYQDYTASLLWEMAKSGQYGKPVGNGEYLIDSKQEVSLLLHVATLVPS